MSLEVRMSTTGVDTPINTQGTATTNRRGAGKTNGHGADASNRRDQPEEKLREASATGEFRRGGRDDSGAVIEDIFYCTDRFIIYESAGRVCYKLLDGYDDAKGLRKRISCLGGLRASIEGLRSQSALSAKEKKRAGQEIAWALAEAFEADDKSRPEMPKEVLERVDARLRSLVKSGYRRKFIMANLTAFLCIVSFLVLVASLLHAIELEKSLDVLPRYALLGAMGGLGAFLSVMIGVRSIDVDLDLRGWEHVYSGATRIFIGVIGAWVVALALESKFVDPTLGLVADGSEETSAEMFGPPLDKHLALFMILAFIAGFSESLVPNLLRRGEAAASGEKADEPIVQKMQPEA
jgi:hypothetical protein